MSTAPTILTVEQLSQLAPLENLCSTPLIARGLNVIFGPSGVYKSFYTLHQSLVIAQSAPVVYVAAEGSSGLHQRIESWCQYNETGPGELYFVCEEINLRDSTAMAEFIRAVRRVTNPALVVFDTFARCLVGGDENTAKDTGFAIHNCATVQRSLDTAVALVHHSNRAERGERGSGAIRGAADAMIEMAPTGDGAIRISCSKIKDAEPWEPVEYRFHPVGASGVLLPSTDAALIRRLTPQEVAILEFLALDVFDTVGASAKQIVSALNIQERHVYRLLSNLKHDMTIYQDSKGDPYSLTAKGFAAICKNPAKKAQLLKAVDSTDYDATAPTDISLQDDSVSPH